MNLTEMGRIVVQAKEEILLLRQQRDELLKVCKSFTPAAHAARDVINGAGLPCPASIALAAEWARNTVEHIEKQFVTQTAERIREVV